jgi:hypothetical protein
VGIKQVMKNANKILDGKSPGKRPLSKLGKPKNIIHMDLKEI